MVGDVPVERPIDRPVPGGLYRFTWGRLPSTSHLFSRDSGKMNPNVALMGINTATDTGDGPNVNCEFGSCIKNGVRRPCVRLVRPIRAGDFVNVEKYAHAGVLSNLHFRRQKSWEDQRMNFIKEIQKKCGSFVCSKCLHMVHSSKKGTHNIRCPRLQGNVLTPQGLPKKCFLTDSGEFDHDLWLVKKLSDTVPKGPKFKLKRRRDQLE